MHGSLNPHHLLRAELDQARESGHDIAGLEDRIARLGGAGNLGSEEAEALLGEVDEVPRRADWVYDEPAGLADIKTAARWSAPSASIQLDAAYEAAVHRAWTGRVVGNMLGKPVEGWPRADIKNLLDAYGAWPLTDYFPAPTGSHEGLREYVACWVDTTAGRIDGSARDDDVDYTILNLDVLRTRGAGFGTDDIAAAWLSMLPFLQTYTAERVAIRNLARGDEPSRAALWRNPYREFIGAAIRADVFGYVCPGDPLRAAELAYRDAVLSHTANGVYGEMWCAALVAAAFVTDAAEETVDRALAVVPAKSRLYETVDRVRGWWASGSSWAETRDHIETEYGAISWVHVLPNAAVLTAGLLYGSGKFDDTIGLTVAAGLDTDSNGATAGSIAGIAAASIDQRWTGPLHDTVRSAVFGYDGSSINGLAQQTVEVARNLNSVEPIHPTPVAPRELW